MQLSRSLGVPCRVVLAFTLILVSIATVVCAEDIELGPGQSIQTAIQQASEGAVIRLLPGTYRGNLQVAKGIHLIGDLDHPGDVILEGRTAGPVIMVSGSDAAGEASFQGLTLRGASGYLPDGILDVAAYEVRCVGLVIEDCAGNGITAAGPGAVSIEDCAIHDNDGFGIDVQREQPAVTGRGNELRGNGAALGGFADPGLRVPLVSQTTSRTLYVPLQYETLQEALDAAPDGATIHVAAGQFSAGVTVWKSVTVIGSGTSNTTLLSGERGTVIASLLASAHDVTLQNLTLDVTERTPIAVYGMLTLDHVHVTGQDTVNQIPAVKVAPEARADIRDCRFEHIGGVAVSAMKDADISISRCTFANNHQDLAIDGAESASVQASQFTSTRERSVTIESASFVMDECTFDDCLMGVSVADSTGTLCGVETQEVVQNAIEVFAGADIVLEECTLAGSGGHNVALTGDAAATLLKCDLRDATVCGLATLDTSSVVMTDCNVSGNGGGGVFAGTDSHVIVHSTRIAENESAGIVMSPFEPEYDVVLDVSPRSPGLSLPTVEAYDSEIVGNSNAGVYVHSVGRLILSNCTVAGNWGDGIELDGTYWHISTSFMNPSSTIESIEGIEATVSGCEIRNHMVAGLVLTGGARAALTTSTLSNNNIGILMEISSWLDLQSTGVVRSVGYGIWFDSEDCDDPLGGCPPEPGHLTGFGNTIPGPGEENGNGIGAYTSGDFPCLTLPEGCE